MKIFNNVKIVSLVMALLIGIQGNPLKAEDSGKEKEGGIDINLNFYSGYLWRGFDLYRARYDQDKKPDGSFNMAPGVAPDITFNSATLEGLSFTLWAQFPLTNRSDSAAGAGDGLRIADEVDYVVNYEHNSKFGTFSASYLILSFPHNSSINGSGSYSELGFGFSIEPVKNLSIALNHSIASPLGLYNSGETYSTISFGYTMELSKGLEIAPALKVGHWFIPGSDNFGPGKDGVAGLPTPYTDVNTVADNGDNFTHIDLGVDISKEINKMLKLQIGVLGSYRLFTKNQKSGLDPSDNTKLYDFPALIAQVYLGVGISL